VKSAPERSSLHFFEHQEKGWVELIRAQARELFHGVNTPSRDCPDQVEISTANCESQRESRNGVNDGDISKRKGACPEENFFTDIAAR
jgi:hypothetical protein